MDALLSTGALPVQSTGYDVDHSCKFEHDNAESLYKDQVQGTQTTWTFSTWLKRTQLSDTTDSYMHVWAAGSSSSDNGTKFYFRGDSSFPGNQIFFYMDNGGSQYFHGATAQSFRDISAWYHIVWAVDTTQGTAGNRSKVYINGVLQTLVGVSGAAYADPPQNSSTRVNDNGGVMYVGAQNQNGGNRFNGYLAETVLVDGSQLAVTDFGEFDDGTGIWIPKDVSELSFGTRGFYLDYSDADNLGHDADGSAEFTESYLTAVDQATDTPTNNFCTLNPLIPYAVQSGTPVISHANTYHNGSGGWTGMKGTIGVNKGKWYWELSMGGAGGGVSVIYGVQTVTSLSGESTATSAHNLLETAAWYVNGGHWIKDETSGRDDVAAGSVTHTPGNTVVYAVALNMDDGEITYYANGSAITNLTDLDLDGLDGETVAPFASVYNQQLAWNFGGYTTLSISSAATDANGYGTFEYAPPSGYYALCTQNLEKYG